MRLLASLPNLSCPNASQNSAYFPRADRGERFYIIAEGIVEVVQKGANEEQRRIATLRDGDFFGEMALIKDISADSDGADLNGLPVSIAALLTTRSALSGQSTLTTTLALLSLQAGTGIGDVDNHPVRLNFDPDDMTTDEGSIIRAFGRVCEMASH